MPSCAARFLFVVALAISLAVGGGEIYNREMFVRYPALAWGLVATLVAIAAYLLFAIRAPLHKLPALIERAP